MMKGIEEQVEDIAKQQLTEAKVKHFAKNESVNTEIDEALKLAKSKNGGQGGNLPDIKVLLSTKDFPNIPVLIEVKGTKGALVKKDASGLIANVTAKGESDWKTIKKYAVNGAVHYAEAVLQLAKSYDRAFAIGINGVLVNGEISLELGVYYLSKDNALVPKEVGTYSDLTFLAKAHLPELCEKIDLLKLTPGEQEERDRDFESRIEAILQRLNQRMHDELNIKDTERVQLVCGMIMAALGVESDDGSYKVLPLEVTELKGETGAKNNDGQKILDKISDFLAEKKLPEQKKETIQNIYKGIFTNKTNYTPKNGESPVHVVYVAIHDDLMPVFRSARHLDFAGRLFNVLNSWIALRPGDDKNDVVLTPRYVCRLMAKLCRVNMDSYVWDYAAGSAGFLVTALGLMLEDAATRIKSPAKLAEKKDHIKFEQLLGVEIRPDIYVLAVLNMILMGDGSANIINEDSLKDYQGKYEQGANEGKPFPANVFLLNPPYSAAGKGLVFVRDALNRMKGGRAAVLIQENAGSGQGQPFAKDLLKNNTLVASIHMTPKLFIGKSSVQTAIYVFDIGIPHDTKKKVHFIDFEDDGYTRMSRKKASAKVNLRDTGDAIRRYNEVVDIVLGNTPATHYLDKVSFEDTISLDGDDWTVAKHRKIDTKPTEADFRKTISDYLSWKVSTLLEGRSGPFV